MNQISQSLYSKRCSIDVDESPCLMTLLSFSRPGFQHTIEFSQDYPQEIKKSKFISILRTAHTTNSLWIEQNRPAIWRNRHSFDECHASNSPESVHSPYWMVAHFSSHWMCCSSRWPRWLAIYPNATISTNDPFPMTWCDCRAYRNQHSAPHHDVPRHRRKSQRTHPILYSTIAMSGLCLPTTVGAVSLDWI